MCYDAIIQPAIRYAYYVYIIYINKFKCKVEVSIFYLQLTNVVCLYERIVSNLQEYVRSYLLSEPWASESSRQKRTSPWDPWRRSSAWTAPGWRWAPGSLLGSAPGSAVELQTKVHTKVRNHEEGHYSGPLLASTRGPSPGWKKLLQISQWRPWLRHYLVS